MTRFFRMLVGYLLASFGAAMTLGLFAFAPTSIEAFFDRLPEILENAWHASIGSWVVNGLWGVMALLGAVPAIIALQYAESNRIRSWVYYELVGGAVAIAGYWLAHGTETVPLRSDGNVYGTITFGVAGAVLGLLYWLFAGRWAGHETAIPVNRPGTGSGTPNRPQTGAGKPPANQGTKKATA